MWLVRRRIRNARPWARGRMRLAVGPPSAETEATTRVAGSKPLLFWALAAALAMTLATGRLAACGAQRRMSSASDTDLPRTRLITRRALVGDVPDEPRDGAHRRHGTAEFSAGGAAHRRFAFRSSLMCPLKVRVGANSPSL